MNFRAKGQRDDRRRRIASEISDAVSTSTSINKESSVAVPRYTDAAVRENQPHVTDLIPIRKVACFGLLFLLLAIAGGIHALGYFSDSWLTSDAIDPLKLTGTGNLAGWFNSFILTLAASSMLIIYLVRRHKVDDYKGRYRIWLAASVGCMVLSLAVITEFHQIASALMVQMVDFDTTLGGLLPKGAIWWLGPMAIVGGYIALRLFFEISESKLSMSVLICSVTLLSTATTFHFGWVAELNILPHQTIITSGLFMGSAILLFMMTLLHARFCLLDAHGLIEVKTKVKKPKVKKEKKQKQKVKRDDSKDTSDSQKTIFLEEQRQKRASILKPSQARKAESQTTSNSTLSKRDQRLAAQLEEEIEELETKPDLSKAERRRLKKLQRRQLAA